MASQAGYQWLEVPRNEADVAKFVVRYGLQPSDVESLLLDGQLYLKVSTATAAKVGSDPVFEKPQELVPMTRVDYAAQLAEIVFPIGDPQQKAAVVDLILRITGDRAPGMKPKQVGEAVRLQVVISDEQAQ